MIEVYKIKELNHNQYTWVIVNSEDCSYSLTDDVNEILYDMTWFKSQIELNGDERVYRIYYAISKSYYKYCEYVDFDVLKDNFKNDFVEEFI